MALSADQQAMLQLLLERGQSYSDLASVLGVDEAEVQGRARAALAELAGVDPDRNVGLTDYLLGQADPIGRADAVRHLKDDPEDLALATELAQKLRLLAPQAELPRLPGEERRPRPRRASRLPTSRLRLPARLRRAAPSPAGEAQGEATTAPRRGRLTTLTRRQTQAFVALGSGAVLLAVVLLAVTGAFSSSSNSSSDTSGTGTTTSTTPAGTQNLARVQLTPQSGGSGSGTVAFGLANGQTPFVDVSLKGLKLAPANQTYVIWLLLTPTQGYPLSPIPNCPSPQPCLAKNGTFSNRFPIPSPILPVITRVQLVNVSVAPVNAVRSAIQTAIKQKHIVIKRPGTSILQGAIPKAASPGG